MDDDTRPRRWPWITGGVTVVVLIAAAVFQPWLLFVDNVVDEAVPTAIASNPAPTPSEAATPTPTASASVTPAPVATVTPPAPETTPPTEPAAAAPATPAPASSAEPAAPTGPIELASGTFTSHEHSTTGTARILQLDNGERTLVLDNLDTSNGPDLQVWLTDQPVIEGRDGWHVFDDGTWTNLGALRGNIGTQQYAIPASVDLSSVTSISIWCARFSVSFGAAPLAGL